MLAKKPLRKVVTVAVLVTVGGCWVTQEAKPSRKAETFERFETFEAFPVSMVPVPDHMPVVIEPVVVTPAKEPEPVVILEAPPAVPKLKPLARLIVANFPCPYCDIQETKIGDVEALGYRVKREVHSSSPLDGFPVWHYQLPNGKWKYSHDASTIEQDMKGTVAQSTRLQTCGCEGWNESQCLCLKAGMVCHCSKGVGSVHQVDANGRSLGKTGQYADPNRTF